MRIAAALLFVLNAGCAIVGAAGHDWQLLACNGLMAVFALCMVVRP